MTTPTKMEQAAQIVADTVGPCLASGSYEGADKLPLFTHPDVQARFNATVYLAAFLSTVTLPSDVEPDNPRSALAVYLLDKIRKDGVDSGADFLDGAACAGAAYGRTDVLVKLGRAYLGYLVGQDEDKRRSVADALDLARLNLGDTGAEVAS